MSKGSAQVFYTSKEHAGEAIQKLYFEKELGNDISVDFFKLKEARIKEIDKGNDDFLR